MQYANINGIFEAFSAKVSDIVILWIAAPVTGLILQPIIGHMSDKTWNRFGRRRPYFMVGAILSSMSLLIMPNSPALWVTTGLIWMMHASINISMVPFRAFLADMLPREQRTTGFAMQSFFISTGAVVASALPYVLTNCFDVPNIVAVGEKIPQSVKLSLYLGGAVFLLTVFWTVFSTREYSPEELSEFEVEHKQLPQMEETHYSSAKKLLPTFIKWGFICLILGIFGSVFIQLVGGIKELYILSAGVGVFGLVLLISAWYTRQGLIHNGFVEIITDLMNMSKTMKQLAIVQIFSWLALFDLWIYSTTVVTGGIYGTSNTASALYNEGRNWVGVLFVTYNGFAAVVTFLLPLLAKWTSRKITHAIALFCGGIGLASFCVIKDPYTLLVSMLGIGFAWASILSMPYAILIESLPTQKIGTYMGIFNLFIVIPQILAGSALDFLTKVLFRGQTICAFILGSVFLLIAALCVLFINDVNSNVERKKDLTDI